MTNDMNHEWADRLSEFLDGTLEVSEEQAVAEHLETCGECRATLEELRHVVARAAGLAPVQPPRDLWPGIAAAIQAPVGSEQPQVIALPARRWAGDAPGRRALSLSYPQLAAAAVVLMLMSATITFAVGPGVAVRDAGTVQASGVVGFAAQSELPAAPESLSQELADLERQLMELGGSLDEETLAVLQSNLAVIERAIEDSRRALVEDPANDFLLEHLERSYESKLDFLREAVQIVNWAS